MSPHPPAPPLFRPSALAAAILAVSFVGVAGCSGIGTQDGSAPLPADVPTADAAVRSTPVVPGQETTIQYSAQGTCIGQKTQGTGVYYTARTGQQGTDRFSVAAKLGTGETATRTFEVKIAE